MTVSVYTDLASLPDTVAKQLSTNAGLPFFRSIEWFSCLANHGMDRPDVRLYLANVDDELAALYCRREGSRLCSLSNFYTIDYGPVGPPGALQEILEFIAAERPRWSVLDFRNLHEADQDNLRSVATGAGYHVSAWDQYNNWFLDASGQNFEQYYRQRSSKLRNTIERKTRKVQREHELRLEIYPGSSATLQQAIEHFEAVYSASWKDDEPFKAFMPALFRSCDRNGSARVGMAWIDGAPAAAQLWIKDGSRSYIYKLAYDEKYADLSVGSILSRAMFEHALDKDNVEEIDYGTGDEAYKREWMTISRSLGGIIASNRRTLRGFLRSLKS